MFVEFLSQNNVRIKPCKKCIADMKWMNSKREQSWKSMYNIYNI